MIEPYARVAAQPLASPSPIKSAGTSAPNEPAVELMIEREAPFLFTYTKVRADTGQAIWRWPNADGAVAPKAMGGLIDLIV